MFIVNSSEIILKSVYSLSAVSEKIGMPSIPPNLGENDSSFRLIFLL